MRKEEIIAAIRTLAAAHNGQPPGLRAMREADIQEHDWLGKYWVRWSDALREAGFTPNRWQAGYDEDFMLRKFAGLIRDMGHFPTQAEFRLRRRGDPTFPGEKTYRARFGGKARLAAKLRAYCQGRPGWRGVAALCAAVEATVEAPAFHEAAKADEDGYVYLLRSGRFYKIGRTNCVGRRERELALLLPEQARRLHTIKTDDPAGVEAYWHRRFAARRKNGEFFALRAEDVRAFKRWRRI
jgi:hypothetical protein